MARHNLTADDMALVKKYIIEELNDVVEAFDQTAMQNLTTVAQSTDRNTHNILKLQSQITALKNMLIEKGTVSKGQLYGRESEALERLEKVATPESVATA